MTKRSLETCHTASLLRALVGAFVVSALIFSGLFSSVSIAEAQRGESNPIQIKSLNNVLFYRIKSDYRNHYTPYCGHYSFDDAWIAHIPGGRPVCIIYRAEDNSFWMMRGDFFVPLESDIFGLLVSVGDQQALFVDCDEDVLRCENPLIMPPSGGIDLNSRDNMTIEEVITEEENTEPEGYPPLKERVLSLDDMDWWATLCYVTDTLSYSDNCDEEHAPPINFVIQRPGYETFGNFSLIWHGDGAARGYLRSFPKKYISEILSLTLLLRLNVCCKKIGMVRAMPIKPILASIIRLNLTENRSSLELQTK